jgi:CheY-like chemotaxis protein
MKLYDAAGVKKEEKHMNFAILQVEDREEDVQMFQRAFKEAGVTNPLNVVHDGQEAIDYLSGAREFADRDKYPLPCMVLLEWKLPGISGLEVLRWIRQQTQFQSLIILILTDSQEAWEVEQAYMAGANSFLVKPFGEEEMIAMILSIKVFWVDHTVPPPECKQHPVECGP